MRLSYSKLGLNQGEIREYTFTLRGPDGDSSEYFMAIANTSFVAHPMRYQDAPDSCSLWLRREFAAKTDHPPSTRFCMMEAELADYRDAHSPKQKPGASARREDNEY